MSALAVVDSLRSVAAESGYEVYHVSEYDVADLVADLLPQL